MAAAPKPPALPFRVGHGFDLHRLEPGLPFIIGGISIPHDRCCDIHSDGDVLLYCVVDTILGALWLPDIGQIFPDSDPRWKSTNSSVFMREAVLKTGCSWCSRFEVRANSILELPDKKKGVAILGRCQSLL